MKKKTTYQARWSHAGEYYLVLVRPGLAGGVGIGRTLAGAQRRARRNLADALGVPKRRVKITLHRAA